jgi:hypothetical protein
MVIQIRAFGLTVYIVPEMQKKIAVVRPKWVK